MTSVWVDSYLPPDGSNQKGLTHRNSGDSSPLITLVESVNHSVVRDFYRFSQTL